MSGRGYGDFRAARAKAGQVSAARRAAKKVAEEPGLRTVDHETVVVTPLEDERALDIPALMERYHLDPTVWEPERSTANRYEGYIKGEDGEQHVFPLWQFKVVFRLISPFPFAIPPLPAEPWKPPTERPTKLAGKPRLYIVTSDSQIPFHEEALHQLSLQFARDVHADGWLDLGDWLDWDTLSRFRKKPGFHSLGSEALAVGSRLAHERSCALPPYAVKQALYGNHDVRPQNMLFERLPDLAELAAPSVGGQDGYAIMDPFRWMHFAAFGWEVKLNPRGHAPYPYAQLDIAPGNENQTPLIGIHGNEAKGGSGQSVLAELAKWSATSIMQGHANYQAEVTLVKGDHAWQPVVQEGFENGLMGRVDDAMGFGKRPVPDWRQGFRTVTLYDDGSWFVEKVPYAHGEIRWRGQVWR